MIGTTSLSSNATHVDLAISRNVNPNKLLPIILTDLETARRYQKLAAEGNPMAVSYT